MYVYMIYIGTLVLKMKKITCLAPHVFLREGLAHKGS